MTFEIIPAIDLKEGCCVRLYQGDFRQATVFSEDPVAVARQWEALGAPRLHVVDLDGARQGELVNTPIIRDILAAVRIPLQVGGGIRQMESIFRLLSLGVQRVILGTVAVEKPMLVQRACIRFEEAIVVAIDGRGEYVATRGWDHISPLFVKSHLQKMVALGVRRFIYTGIDRDGTLTEPDFTTLESLTTLGVSNEGRSVPIIAAGGIARIDHLKKLKGLGLEGAILGMALYTGEIDLAQALKTIDHAD